MECQSHNWWKRLAHDILVGSASAVIALIPALLLSFLHRRSFVRVPPGNPWRGQRQMLSWRIQDLLLWTFGVAWVLFCTLFISVFLSNVTSTDRYHWMTAFCTSALRVYALQPLEIAFFLALTVWMCLKHKPNYLEMSKSLLGLQHDADMDISEAQLEATSEAPQETPGPVPQIETKDVQVPILEISPKMSSPRLPHCECRPVRIVERTPYPEATQPCFWCHPERFLWCRDTDGK